MKFETPIVGLAVSVVLFAGACGGGISGGGADAGGKGGSSGTGGRTAGASGATGLGGTAADAGAAGGASAGMTGRAGAGGGSTAGAGASGAGGAKGGAGGSAGGTGGTTGSAGAGAAGGSAGASGSGGGGAGTTGSAGAGGLGGSVGAGGRGGASAGTSGSAGAVGGNAGIAGGGGTGGGSPGSTSGRSCAPIYSVPTTCSERTPQSCGSDSKWTDRAEGPCCGANAGCYAGSCVKCQPNTHQCRPMLIGGVPSFIQQTCNTSGQGWYDAATLASAAACGAVCGAAVTAASPQSCAGGGVGAGNNCGSNGNEDCCASPAVSCGVYNRSNDSSSPATISDFQLDKYEITVGRFRTFVSAGMGTKSNPPAPGAGAHPTLTNSGWNPSWNALLPDAGGYAARDGCGTWTASVGPNEKKPMSCLSWYEAFAFCAWDGGRLPTEAEWNYAAAGGSEQRLFPWGNNAPGPDANLAVQGCYYNGNGTCTGLDNIAPVGSIPAGNGKWGQSDLAGNVMEWTLDFDTFYETPCLDCGQLLCGIGKETRGGAFADTATGVGLIRTLARVIAAPEATPGNVGVRCARPGRIGGFAGGAGGSGGGGSGGQGAGEPPPSPNLIPVGQGDTSPWRALNVTAPAGEHSHNYPNVPLSAPPTVGIDTRAAPVGKLAVTLDTGTGVYEPWLGQRGFHVFGVQQSTQCSFPTSGMQPDDPGNCRLGLFDGQGHGSRPALPGASIAAQVQKGLADLQAQYPEEDWGYFLNQDGTVRWSDVAVVGVHGGAATAAVIGHAVRLYRVVSFDGPADNACGTGVATGAFDPGNPPWVPSCSGHFLASWIDQVTVTPFDRYYWPVGMKDPDYGSVQFAMDRMSFPGAPVQYDVAGTLLQGTNRFYADAAIVYFPSELTPRPPRTDEVLNLVFGVPPGNQHPSF